VLRAPDVGMPVWTFQVLESGGFLVATAMGTCSAIAKFRSSETKPARMSRAQVWQFCSQMAHRTR